MATLRIATAASLTALAAAKTKDTATPPLGWNSYNSYSCSPSEAIMRENAQGLVDSGLAARGYTVVTTDCGWNAPSRDNASRLVWNPELFPSGGAALGEFLHGLGLEFGVYSGGGYYQCGSEDLPASLGFEEIDAATFATWGADALKYDNCYSTSPDVMVDYETPEAGSPDRFVAMSEALNKTGRDIVYEICQWGCGIDVADWAAPVSNMFRISNDIYNSWRSIWRITNQVVPFSEGVGPGAFPDMDMLIIGLDALTETEEKFHMSMWAMEKSPLIIGCRTTPGTTPASSLAILSNEGVLAISQDPLGKAATLRRRHTEEEWDIWAGPLSGSRMVLALANWNADGQAVSANLTEALGVQSASVRDVWSELDVGVVDGTYEANLAGHELRLLVLSDIVAADVQLVSTGYRAAAEATLSGAAKVEPCGSADCAPTHSKVVSIGQSPGAAAVTFRSVAASGSGHGLLGVDYINYDVALSSAWDWGSNTRNMSIAVNGGEPRRFAFPISGGDWYETGRLSVEVDGFVAGGDNEVVFTASGGEGADVLWAPDLVGMEVLEYV